MMDASHHAPSIIVNTVTECDVTSGSTPKRFSLNCRVGGAGGSGFFKYTRREEESGPVCRRAVQLVVIFPIPSRRQPQPFRFVV